MSDISFSVGICAYNEKHNVEKCIRSVYSQRLNSFTLKETIVVSSASTDGTDSIVRTLIPEYPSLKLISQKKREGKNSAINCFLNAKKTDIVVIVNADTTFSYENSLQKLLEPFRNTKIGMTGGHPIPLNTKKTIAGFASNMIWCLHHNIAVKYPKIGEIIAYRDIGTRLKPEYQSDEDLIRIGIEKAGYVSRYVPEATVYNKGPETISDLIKQRTRINIGQSYMIQKNQYYNPARDPRILFSVFKDTIKDLGIHPFKISISIIIELYCRLKAKRLIKNGINDDNIWSPVESTKNV